MVKAWAYIDNQIHPTFLNGKSNTSSSRVLIFFTKLLFICSKLLARANAGDEFSFYKLRFTTGMPSRGGTSMLPLGSGPNDFSSWIGTHIRILLLMNPIGKYRWTHQTEKAAWIAQWKAQINHLQNTSMLRPTRATIDIVLSHNVKCSRPPSHLKNGNRRTPLVFLITVCWSNSVIRSPLRRRHWKAGISWPNLKY